MNLKVGHRFLDEGDQENASKSYRKSFSKASLVFELFEELRKENIEFLVSPYEGDAQLAYLFKEGLIDVALSDDTDLLPYGCDRVIFSLDKDGWVKYFDRSVLGQYETVLAKVNERGKCEDGASTSGKKGKSREVINLSTLNDDQIILYCIMKGCDYFKGFNYPQDKLLGLVQDSDYDETMQKLRDMKLHKFKKTETSIHQAYLTYKHHLVFDPRPDVRRVVNLTEPEKSMDLTFLGPVIPDEIARQIADGLVDPKARTPYKAPKGLDFLSEMMENGKKVEQRDLENEWNMWIEHSGGISIKHEPFKNFDDFLRIFKSACLASKLEDGAKVYFFLEDNTLLNADGCWTQRLRLSEVDKSWLYNLLALIEGKIDPQLVLGTILSITGNWAELKMWTKNASKNDQLAIAKKWKCFTRHEYVIGYSPRVIEDANSIPSKQYIYMT